MATAAKLRGYRRDKWRLGAALREVPSEVVLVTPDPLPEALRSAFLAEKAQPGPLMPVKEFISWMDRLEEGVSPADRTCGDRGEEAEQVLVSE